MSARINDKATENIEFSCVCEGQPHEVDTVTVRSEYGYGDLTDIQVRTLKYVPVKQEDGTTLLQAITDPEGEHFALLQTAITGWSFLEDDGTPMPVTLTNIRTLREEIGDAIGSRVNALYLAAKKRQQLPNPSGGRSPLSSPESSSASSNRAKRRAAKRSKPRSSSAPDGPASS